MTRGLDRRRFAIAGAGLIAAARAPAWAQSMEAPLDANVLRILFEAAETGFDPAQVSDLYSNRVNAHIFEALLGYDPIAIPVRLVPLTAEAMPEVSADSTTWTLRLRRGIRFADDPAFNGQPRELVAADYVYSFKRIYDPAW
jgi:ABC-type transport system substrate-binding protein